MSEPVDPGQGCVSASRQGLLTLESGSCERVCRLCVSSPSAPSLGMSLAAFGFRPLMELGSGGGLRGGGCQSLTGHSSRWPLRFLSASSFRPG